MSVKNSKYKFSLIMPIYNTASFIEEAVDSILSQTINFEKNCEIIFINDGSTDNSENICLEYKNRFPNNITYIKQANQGVSAARNSGLKLVSGKYISFIDSDDKISIDTLEEVYKFFEAHQNEIDICTIKMDLFDAKEGDHHLNDKFNSSRIIDIEKDYQHVISAIGPCFIKSSVLEKRCKFDTDLEVIEDGKFLTEILLDKMRYGVVYGPTYYYRKRLGEESALSGRWSKKSWYETTPEKCFEYLFKYSKQKFGYIPKYVQFFAMYHIKWAIRKNNLPNLSEQEIDKYRKRINKILKSIDKDIIVRQKNFPVDYKVYTISEKLNKPINSIIKYQDGRLYVDGTVVQNIKNLYVGIDFIKIKNGFIEIEGYTHGYDVNGYKFGFTVDDKFYKGEDAKRAHMERYSLGKVSFTKMPFVVRVPIKSNENRIQLQPTVFIDNESYRIKSLRFKQFARLTEGLDVTYAIIDEKIVYYKLGRLNIQSYKLFDHFKKEIKYLQQFMHLKRYDVVFMRLAVLAGKIIHRKPIWIVSDRLVSAGDNGEALFKYISKQNNVPAKVFFAVNKSSPDFNSMKKYGNVVNRQSFKYKVLFLSSDKIISSHFDKFVFDAFGDKDKNQRNLYNFNYVFLRHGVSKDDMSKQINKYKINASLIMSSSKLEHDDIVNNTDKYGYSEDNIKLTGLPRYDYLNNDPKKLLILAPTWRKSLTIKPSEDTDRRSHDKNFKKTDYFKFYSRLINDKRVVDVLKNNNMKCEFYLHPALTEQAIDFQDNEVVSIKSAPYNYKRAFSEGELLITDYSSVAFDFAYLKKPVLYTQFDKDQFFKHQYQPGYFSYEKNGFGEVVYDYESAICSIIKTIDDNNIMPDIYKNRVDRFFLYNDKNNSKRVYEVIREI